MVEQTLFSGWAMRIILVGMPLTCGGGGTESGDTVLMWRRAGIDVSVLYFDRCKCGKPCTKPVESNPWVNRLKDVGVDFIHGESSRLKDVPGLAGSILVSFRCLHALHNWHELEAMGCKLVWSPLMTRSCIAEHHAFYDHPPSAAHFQSRFQYRELVGDYVGWKCRNMVHIPGAFEPLKFRPRAYQYGQPFVVGRLARDHVQKWNPDFWQILSDVRSRGVDVRALCMAWNDELTEHCGPPPSWATVHPKDSMSAQEFLDQCHALICPNWNTPENWPRVGLEAMSAGVPVLADDAGGWKEMLTTFGGFLCDSAIAYTNALVELAEDEDARQAMIHEGLCRARDLQDEQTSSSARWVSLFRMLA